MSYSRDSYVSRDRQDSHRNAYRDEYRDRRYDRRDERHPPPARARESYRREERESRDSYSRHPKISPPRRRSRRSPSPYRRNASVSPPKRRKRSGSAWDRAPNASQLLSGFNVAPPHPDLPIDSSRSHKQSQRLYVGNLPASLNERAFQQFFNDSMKKALVSHKHGDPITSVYLKLDKRFGFIEFRTSAEATAGLHLDGIEFGGMSLRLRRPSDFEETLKTRSEKVPEMDVSRLGMVSTQVQRDEHRIFVGNLPLELGERHVKQVLECFGPLKAFELVRDVGTSVSRGVAFCAFSDTKTTRDVCEALHGLKVGENLLTVKPASEMKEFLERSGLESGDMVNPLLELSEVVPEPPSNVVCFMQMVTREELLDQQEYDDIKEDIRLECSNHGIVRAIEIPRPNPNSMNPVPGEGKVYVQFNDIQQATKARDELQGRKFASRTILAQYFDAEKFAKKQFF